MAFTETDNVDLTERDVMRDIAMDRTISFPSAGLRKWAESYAEDAVKMMPPDSGLAHHVRLYARIAFRLARRAYGETS